MFKISYLVISQDGLCYEFGISEILWDCGWETAHRRGSLASFRHGSVVQYCQLLVMEFYQDDSIPCA